jgi:hypothetical protein
MGRKSNDGHELTLSSRGERRPYEKKSGERMHRRDWILALGGPALAAVVVISIYEGKAPLAPIGESSESRGRDYGSARSPGEIVPEGDHGVSGAERQLTGSRELQKASESGAAPEDEEVARQLDGVKAKLAGVQREKRDLEAQLRTLEKELDQRPGAPGGDVDEFDLDPEDWKTLAAEGRIKYRIPCLLPAESSSAFPPEELDELGLAPDDGPTLNEARRRSNARVWSTVRPLCMEAVGDPEVADLLGASNCLRLIEKTAMKADAMAASEARRQVGEVHAGMRQPPQTGDAPHPVFQAYMAVTSEAQRFEADLAESFGPDEAKRIARSMR